jgi:acetoacetyl-CoA synthetase
VTSLLSGLSDKLHTIPKVIVIHTLPSKEDRSLWDPSWIGWDTFVSIGKDRALGRKPDGEIEWYRQEFDAPLWILFSSGTTGRPKYVHLPRRSSFNELKRLGFVRPIVHRAGGMLVQAKKEFAICADLQPDDVFFYYTTT